MYKDNFKVTKLCSFENITLNNELGIDHYAITNPPEINSLVV